MMNFTEEDVHFTRVIEHKHFENSESSVTWISHEYPVEYEAAKTEPYYPVNDKENTERLIKYQELSKLEDRVIFGGRLGEYKYYDMHQVISSAISLVKKIC